MSIGVRFKTLDELRNTEGIYLTGTFGDGQTYFIYIAKSHNFIGCVNVSSLGTIMDTETWDTFSSAVFRGLVTVPIATAKGMSDFMPNTTEKPLISLDKKYRTKVGASVRILCIDGNGSGKVWGIIGNDPTCYYWNEIGQAPGVPLRDLVEVKPKVKVECWVNVYKDGNTSAFDYRVDADGAALRYVRMACIHFEKEVDVSDYSK